ncbi:hypothetical protein RF11_08992 [Thelohanellus kitauei]|uniref:Uncharacterized protein n=1 Tax=Thelohanellus kitauei TaxID=669202 RepID=A0A0C2M700_THEKT|nr:hypothetical protein RF11_08992 [Thelohanellus kitauei]
MSLIHFEYFYYPPAAEFSVMFFEPFGGFAFFRRLHGTRERTMGARCAVFEQADMRTPYLMALVGHLVLAIHDLVHGRHELCQDGPPLSFPLSPPATSSIRVTHQALQDEERQAVQHRQNWQRAES